MSGIVLSAGVRQNLLALQRTSDLMGITQNRLSTGKKVNSALDNPTNFFTSATLQSRSSDLSSLLDGMSNGIKTIEAADNGVSAIKKSIESMQSTIRQARQDKSFKVESYSVNMSRLANASTDTISFTDGAVGPTAVDVNVSKTVQETAAAVAPVASTDDGKQFKISAGGINTTDITLSEGDDVNAIVTKINTAAKAATSDVRAANVNGKIELSSASGAAITVSEGTTTGGAAVLGFASQDKAMNVDEMAAAINNNTQLIGKVRATNDNGKLRIENQSTAALNVTSDANVGMSGAGSIAGNDVRKNLTAQFNDLRNQLDKLSDDASFNGINLLRGDKLKITFNETGTSNIEIQAKTPDGKPTAVNSTTLGITSVTDTTEFDADANLDARLDQLTQALNTLQAHSSSFGSNLSVVQNRQDFTKSMMNTLQTGADALVLADNNEEGANMLALTTRQQLSTTALSLANQAQQAVLRLF